MEQMKPLQGIKVVELSLMVAASSCGRMMADWGADVIKLEDTRGGDYFRKWPAGMGAPAEDGFNPIFDALNSNKRGLSVDLKTPEGREVVYKLLEDADAFVSNIRPAPLKRLGLDYDTLKEKFPRLVVASINGYGEKGPEKDRPGYDNTAFWARGGFMYGQSTFGGPGAYPVYLPMGPGDIVAAMGLMAAIVSAIFSARRTGKGDKVSLSLYGTAMWIENLMISLSQYGFTYPKDREICTPFGSPFKCKDGRWFLPQVVNMQRDKDKYFHLLGADDMIGDPRYAKRDNFNKREICGPVIRRFEKIYATKTAAEWKDLFEKNDLCCEILYSYGETLNDEQAIANGFVYTMHYKNGREAKLVRPCMVSQNLGTPASRPGPMQGEHTVSILTGLGYPKEKIDKLLQDQVVFQHD
jgi:crotonobetainyl-CoA:carnitine CoA-transferase CaiB-like acyl-CoA transferase